MSQKYVPIEKQSKKKQKEHHEKQRRDWGKLNPATRKVPNLKAYDRKKSKQWERYEPRLDFFIWISVQSKYMTLALSYT